MTRVKQCRCQWSVVMQMSVVSCCSEVTCLLVFLPLWWAWSCITMTGCNDKLCRHHALLRGNGRSCVSANFGRLEFWHQQRSGQSITRIEITNYYHFSQHMLILKDRYFIFFYLGDSKQQYVIFHKIQDFTLF